MVGSVTGFVVWHVYFLLFFDFLGMVGDEGGALLRVLLAGPTLVIEPFADGEAGGVSGGLAVVVAGFVAGAGAGSSAFSVVVVSVVVVAAVSFAALRGATGDVAGGVG